MVAGGEVRLGGGGFGEGEEAGALNRVEVGFAAGLAAQPGAEESALGGQGQGGHGRDGQARRGGLGGDEGFHPFVLGGEDGGGAGEGGDGVESDGFSKDGQDIVPEAVARVVAGGVGFVLAEGEAVTTGVGGEFGAGEGKEGAGEGEVAAFERRAGARAGQAARTTAAGEVEEDGLGDIAGVVAEENDGRPVLAGRAGEERPAEVAGGFLEGLFFPRCDGARVAASGNEGQAEPVGEVADEFRIRIGRRAPESVVEVGDDQAAEPGAVEEVEQGDGVEPAGDGDEGGRSGVEVAHRGEEAREEVAASFHGRFGVGAYARPVGTPALQEERRGHWPYRGLIRAEPKYGCRISGRWTEPSGCCPFSSSAT